MNFLLPRIQLVNSEIKDPGVYTGKYEFTNEELGQNFSLKIHDVLDDSFVFFIHYALFYEVEGDKILLIHLDYLSLLNTEEALIGMDSFVIDKNTLAHNLGISIIMIRGSMMTLLQNHPLGSYTLPTLNPLEQLEKKLTTKDNNFIIDRGKV